MRRAILETGYYVSDPCRTTLDAPCGLVRRRSGTKHEKSTAKKKTGRVAPFANSGPRLRGDDHLVDYGFRMRSSSALPIACVRFTTFSLRRIFCTWFFTVSGLILRIAPISKFDLPR
jgi:hypothetical protein